MNQIVSQFEKTYARFSRSESYEINTLLFLWCCQLAGEITRRFRLKDPVHPAIKPLNYSAINGSMHTYFWRLSRSSGICMRDLFAMNHLMVGVFKRRINGGVAGFSITDCQSREGAPEIIDVRMNDRPFNLTQLPGNRACFVSCNINLCTGRVVLRRHVNSGAGRRKDEVRLSIQAIKKPSVEADGLDIKDINRYLRAVSGIDLFRPVWMTGSHHKPLVT